MNRCKILVVFVTTMLVFFVPAQAEVFQVSISNTSSINQGDIKRVTTNALPLDAEVYFTASPERTTFTNVSIECLPKVIKEQNGFKVIATLQSPGLRSFSEDDVFSEELFLKNKVYQLVTKLLRKRQELQVMIVEKQKAITLQQELEEKKKQKEAEAAIQYKEADILDVKPKYFFTLYGMKGGSLYITVKGEKDLAEQCEVFQAKKHQPSVFHRPENPNLGYHILTSESRRGVRLTACERAIASL